MIDKFELGKWYRYTGTKGCDLTIWSGAMEAVLDGKPRECTAIEDGTPYIAGFEDCGNFSSAWAWDLKNWEEVPNPTEAPGDPSLYESTDTTHTIKIEEPKLPTYEGSEFTFSQEGDSNKEGYQFINIKMEDAGGGPFFVIETERWAFNAIEELTNTLEKCKQCVLALGGKM